MSRDLQSCDNHDHLLDLYRSELLLTSLWSSPYCVWHIAEVPAWNKSVVQEPVCQLSKLCRWLLSIWRKKSETYFDLIRHRKEIYTFSLHLSVLVKNYYIELFQFVKNKIRNVNINHNMIINSKSYIWTIKLMDFFLV